MADNKIFNNKDSMDIAELASLNDDISPELIEQLQQKIQKDASEFSDNKLQNNTEVSKLDDENLFEETDKEQNTENVVESNEIKEDTKIHHARLNENFDDNFLKKYKAKLSKQQESKNNENVEKPTISNVAFQDTNNVELDENSDIEKISNGNITERAFSTEQKNYNDSLDFLDGNVKYSKYVIYIDPQNVDFIEHLTVKERKNLINKILREQDDIAITKQRFRIIQTIIRHAIVAVLTVAISIPVVYITINASLEATINNYRRSQSFFQTLYRENGKISRYR